MNARGLAVLVIAPIVAAPLALSGAAAARDAAAGPAVPTQATPTAPVTVAVTDLSPVSATPSSIVTLSGTMTNTTDQEIRQPSLFTGVGNRVTSRDALSNDFAKPPGIAAALTAPTTPLPASLGAHTTVPFTLTIDIHANGLDGGQATVYPIVVRASGALDKAPAATTLSETVTYLPYFPGSVAAPLRVVWIWPLDAPPGGSNTSAADSFPTNLASGGRLRSLLDLGGLSASTTSAGGPYAPVTWAVEPSLLDAADRSDSTAAKQWLSDLKQVTQGQNVIPLPYGDIDAVAVVRAGLSSDLSNAIALGRVGVSQYLTTASIQNVAWPIDGVVDQPTLDAYAAAGLMQALVSGDLVPPADNAGSATESAPVDLETRGPTIRGLAVDPLARDLLAGGGKDAPTPQMAAQQLLALLAVAVAERPNQTPSRDIVLALPRNANPDPSWIKGLLHDTATLPWLTPVSLAATAGDPTSRRTTLQPYPAAARAAELPGNMLAGNAESVAALRAAVTNVRSMLPDDKLTRPIDQTLTQAESVFWRPNGEPAGGRALITSAQSALAGLSGGIRLAVADQVTLTSRDGKVPVTVENSLAEDVTIRIGLSATDPTRLSSTPPETFTVAAGHKQRILVPAKAHRSGTFKVTLVVSTPTGLQLTTVPVTVHSKAYGTITLVITFAALGILVVAFAYRARHRIRRWTGRGPGSPTQPSEAPLIPAGGSGP